jgi:hypothetical protein
VHHPVPTDRRVVQAASSNIKLKQRVRREVRTLSDAEYRAYITALSTLTAVPTKAGRALFGHKYVSYNELLMKHAVAVTDPRGDQASGSRLRQAWGARPLLLGRLLLHLLPLAAAGSVPGTLQAQKEGPVHCCRCCSSCCLPSMLLCLAHCFNPLLLCRGTLVPVS